MSDNMPSGPVAAARAGGSDLLITDCSVLDPDHASGFVDGQHISVNGNRIEAISPGPAEPAVRTIDGRGRLAMPGLVNAHSHSPENMVKATSEGLPLELWLLHLYRGLPTEFTTRQIYLNAAVNALEMIRTGATAVLDHFWMSPAVTPAGLDAAMQAYGDVGLRAAVAPMVGDTDALSRYASMSGLASDEILMSALGEEFIAIEESIRLLEEFADRWHGAAGGRLLALAGPGNVMSCSPEFWAELKAFASRRGIGLHSHAVETRLQAAAGRSLFGKSCVRMLDDVGVLGPDVSLAHCVWLDDGDLERMAASGATLVHNPASNLKLGSGLAPVPRALELGVNVALGADGSASSDNQSIFDAMKLVSLIHNLSSEPPSWPSAREALNMATRGGAAALGMAGSLGTLAPGMLADIVLLDLETTPFAPRNDPFGHLVYCERGSSVRTVIIDGRVVLQDGQVTTVDEKQLLREVTDSWRRLDVRSREIASKLRPQLDALDRFRDVSLQR